MGVRVGRLRDEKISQTDHLVEQIKAAMEEQQVGSQQLVASSATMTRGGGAIADAPPRVDATLSLPGLTG